MPKNLPLPIQYFWDELLKESHPLVQLHWMKDLLELVLRWGVTISLAVLRSLQDDLTLPENLRAQIGQAVERPTLGIWFKILRESLAYHQPSHPILDHVKILQDQINTACPPKGTEQNSLLAMRNLLAHGGGLSPSQSAELLALHLPKMEAIIEAVREIPALVVAVDQARLISISEGSVSPIDIKDLHQHDDTAWLLTERGPIGLAPLLHFRRPSFIGDDGKLKALSAQRCVQLYMRADSTRQAFTPINAPLPVVYDLESELLKQRYGSTKMNITAAFNAVTPLEIALDEGDQMIGRRDELQTMLDWCLLLGPWRPQEKKLAWIPASPGAGKSMLMSGFVKCLYEKHVAPKSNHYGLYFHRFKEADSDSNKRSFYAGLMKAFQAWSLTKNYFKKQTQEEGQTPLSYILQIVGQIRIAPRKDPDPQARTKPMFYILVDGLDELAQRDRSLTKELTELAGCFIAVIVASRPEHGIPEVMEDKGAVQIFDGALRPMTESDIRAMLINGLGQLRVELMARDEWRGLDVHNTFISAVVNKAQGLPIYVQLVINELISGKLTIYGEDQLPQGLSQFYAHTLDQAGVSAVQRDLPLILALITVAREPLTRGALAALLSTPWREDHQDFLQRVDAALRVGQGLLRSTLTPEGEVGWNLYHQSLRDYILIGFNKEQKYKELLLEARRLLWRSTLMWEAHDNEELKRHLYRQGTEYLFAWAPNPDPLVAGRLMNPELNVKRLTVARETELNDWINEFRLVRHDHLQRDLSADWASWLRFVEDSTYLLRSPLGFISYQERLIQLASRYALQSPVSRSFKSHGLLPQLTTKPVPKQPSPLTKKAVYEISREVDKINQVKASNQHIFVQTSEGLFLFDSSSSEMIQHFDLYCDHISFINHDRALLDDQLWDIGSFKVLNEGGFIYNHQGAPLEFGEGLLTLNHGRLSLVDPINGRAVASLLEKLDDSVNYLFFDDFILIESEDESEGTILYDLKARQKSLTVRSLSKIKSLLSVTAVGFDRFALLKAYENKKYILTLSGLKGEYTPCDICFDVRVEVIYISKYLVCIEHEKSQKKSKPHLISVLSANNLELIQELTSDRAVTFNGDHFEQRIIKEQGQDHLVVCTQQYFLIICGGEINHCKLPSPLYTREPLQSHEDQIIVIMVSHVLIYTMSTRETRLIELEPIYNYNLAHGQIFVFYSGQPAAFTSISLTSRKLTQSKLEATSGRCIGNRSIFGFFDTKKKLHLCSGDYDESSLQTYRLHKHVPNLISLEKDQFVTWTQDAAIQWSQSDLSYIFLIDSKETSKINAVYVFEESQRVLLWCDEKYVYLWDAKEQKIVHIYQGEGVHISSHDQLKPLPYGDLLSVAHDGVMCVWGSDGELRTILKGQQASDQYLMLPDQSLLTWSKRCDEQEEWRLFRWSLETSSQEIDNEELQHQGEVLGACEWGPNHFMSFATDQCLILHDMETAKAIKVLYQHDRDISKVYWINHERALLIDSRALLFDISSEPWRLLNTMEFDYNDPKPTDTILDVHDNGTFSIQCSLIKATFHLETGDILSFSDRNQPIDFNLHDVFDEDEVSDHWLNLKNESGDSELSAHDTELDDELYPAEYDEQKQRQRHLRLSENLMLSHLTNGLMALWNPNDMNPLEIATPSELLYKQKRALIEHRGVLDQLRLHNFPHIASETAAIAFFGGLCVIDQEGRCLEWPCEGEVKLWVLTERYALVSHGHHMKMISWEASKVADNQR